MSRQDLLSVTLVEAGGWRRAGAGAVKGGDSAGSGSGTAVVRHPAANHTLNGYRQSGVMAVSPLLQRPERAADPLTPFATVCDTVWQSSLV